MQVIKYRKWVPLLAFMLITGCSSVENIDIHNDQGVEVMGLDYRDFNKAAGEAIRSMLQSNALTKPDGGRYVLAISRIMNDTMQRIDTDQLVKKIRIDLLGSGKVIVTTAVSGGTAEDAMAMKTRKLRDSDEFKQTTVAKKGQMIAPDLSLSGKIIQRNIKIDSDQQQAEYYFQLSLSNINTGLAIWEGETIIGKRGDNDAVSW